MQKYLTRVWAVRYFCISPMGSIPEGVQGASGKPPGRTRRCEIPCETGKSKEDLFPCHPQGICFFTPPLCCKGPEGFQRASGKPFGRLRRGEILRKTGRSKEGLFLAFHKESVSCGRFRPPAGGRGTFPHGKVPKGCRGRPKGACLMAAPGPPVAKLQCTASLAGARPARFTSVPGRATVAFKVGFHFVKAKSLRDPRIRLWRKRGLAQLIPPPAPGRQSIPGVMARSRHGSATL